MRWCHHIARPLLAAAVGLLSLGFFNLRTLGADGPPTLEIALSRIRRNVQTFETQIPDFVCKERITSRNIAEKGNRLEKQTVIESVFSGRQKHSAVNLLVGTSFTEERQIESINGQPWHGSTLPAGVFHLSGGYTSLLVMIFGPGSDANYVFSLAPAATGGPPGAIGLAFASRSGKQKIVEKDGLHSYKASGKAWFDPVSFEILRIEAQIQPKGGELGGELPVVVEYQPVRIGENQFYLPSRVAATARRIVSGKAERGEFTAEYRDYRKYGSSTSIQFSDDDK